MSGAKACRRTCACYRRLLSASCERRCFSAPLRSPDDDAKEVLMTYAPAGRAMYDADSHIMELPDFLQKYADPDIRDQIPAVSYSASIVTDEEVAVLMARGGRHSEEHIASLLELDGAGL